MTFRITSCSILTHTVRGRKILTIEGMAKPDGTLHPLQQPEKLPITASMIVGSMSREFYLKEHDPNRWVVERLSDRRRVADGD